VEVPDLRGKGLDQAASTLAHQGLQMIQAEQSCSLSLTSIVVRQSPAPYTPARKGSAVQVWVAAGLFSPGCWGWLAGGGAAAGLLIWLVVRFLTGGGSRPEAQPPPPQELEVKVTSGDQGKQEVVFPGQDLPALELRLRVTADPGTQDLESTGPLIKGERKSYE